MNKQKQLESFPIQEVILDIGNLIAGMGTVKDGRTLREVKPGIYEPKTVFGKLIDNIVQTTIFSAKRKRHDELMDTLAAQPKLVPYAQQEVHREFIEKFGEEKLKPTPRFEKILGGNIIWKLAALTKINGVPKNEVDDLIYQTVSRVLREAENE